MSQSPATKKTPPLKPVQDLDQIVSEIGELEEGMGLTKPDAESPESEESLMRGLDDLAVDDASDGPKLSLLDDPEPVARVSASTSSEGSLNLTVRGGTEVSLTFEVDGREASVSFKDGVLRVETADGAEFKIPLAS